MITAFVQFKISDPLTRGKAQEIFSSTADKYRGVEGLIRKYYLLSEDGGEEAEQLYTDEWKRFILEKYGSEPSVTYFESPVIVDNLMGKILEDE
jgi:hypothetical protein